MVNLWSLGQAVSWQLELGHNAALSSSQGGVSLVFHVSDGPVSASLFLCVKTCVPLSLSEEG